MDKSKIDDSIEKILNLKKTAKSNFDELNKLIHDAEEVIFNETCLKPYLKRCEPEYCVFRIEDHCNYSDELHRLKIAKEA